TVSCNNIGIADNTNDARGAFNLSAGSLILTGYNGAGNLWVSAGIGTFTQTGGTVASAAGVNASLYVASEIGSVGAYILGDGSISIAAPTGSGGEFIGAAGNGTFSHSGGTNSLTGTASLSLGFLAGGA